MRMILLAAAVLAMCPTGLRAESLAESFARQCARGGARQSEACAVLADALQRKANGPDVSGRAPTAAMPTDAETAALWRRRFGVYADMAGKDWFAVVELAALPNVPYIPGGRTRFRWKEPGVRLVSESENPVEKSDAYPDGVTRTQAEIYWDEARQQLAVAHATHTEYQEVQPDGTVVTAEPTSSLYKVRGSSTKQDDGSIRNVAETLENGVWKTIHISRNIEYSPERVALEHERIAALRRIEKAAAAQAQARREQAEQARADRWSRAMGALNGALDAGLQVARTQEAQSRYELDNTLADIDARIAAQQRAGQPQFESSSTSAGSGLPGPQPHQPSTGLHAAQDRMATQSTPEAQGRSQPATGDVSTAAKPLRFVLTISLRNKPGDTRNPTCYSNVITRPGPPGWGALGFLPSGAAEQAIAQIEKLKAEFIAACRRSGREITSEGNFSHVRNQQQGDDARVQSTRPRFAEDVSVVLD